MTFIKSTNENTKKYERVYRKSWKIHKFARFNPRNGTRTDWIYNHRQIYQGGVKNHVKFIFTINS